MSEVHCQQLEKLFGNVRAVAGVDLQIRPGEIMALLGPSGCGKTTILRLIAGFEAPDGGQIRLDDQIVATPAYLMPPEQRNVGMVFQQHALFPHLSVAANIGFGLRGNAAARRERVRDMLELVELDGLETRMPHQLSGGQQQRVALARALAPNPAVLLLDEPFSNLDADLRATMRVQVRSILKRVGTTALFVTHDQEEALYMGDQVAVIRAGQLEQVATPQELFAAPASRFIAEFVGIASFLPGELTPHGLQTVLGQAPGATSMRHQGTVEVLVRPDDLTLSQDNLGNGRIIERVFRGGEYLYEVLLDSQQTLRCICNHVQDYPLNTRVQVKLEPGHPLVCFPTPPEPPQSVR
jgi:iron(III) transport system ATP-binding protein